MFCLFVHKDKSTVDPMDLDQWRFYVLPTDVLNRTCGAQKRISLSALKKLGPVEARWSELSGAVTRATG